MTVWTKYDSNHTISLATGRYFLADPDSFDKAIALGEIGIIPDWLKTEVNPYSGQPDPVDLLEFPSPLGEEVVERIVPL